MTKKTPSAPATKPAEIATERLALIYFCDDFCSVSNARFIARKGTLIYLLADSTGVRLSFDKSPFRSKRKIIDIQPNTFQQEELKQVTARDVCHYSFSCTECGSGAGEADVVVDP